MLKSFLFLCVIYLCILSHVQGQINQSLKKTIDSMIHKDQKIRQSLSNLNSNYYRPEKSNFLKGQRYKAVQKKIFLHDSLKAEYQFKYDSISAIMSAIDQSNRWKFEKILLKYGYPAKKLVGHYKVDYILLHSNFAWIKAHFPILKEEVKKGNLRAITLANAYDKFLNIEGEEYLYHTLLQLDKSNKITQTIPNDLEKTNAARKELGLKPIKIKKNGKRKK